MLPKAELDKIVEESKSLKTRTEAAEAKVQALEEEKANLVAQLGSKGLGPVGNRSDSDEQRCMRYFGVSHPKQLLAINVAAKRYKHVPDHMKALAINFKQTTDIARFTAQIFAGDPQDVIGKTEKEDRIARCKSILDTRFGKEEFLPQLKAFGSTIVGAGDETVPTMISSNFIPEFELEYALEEKFELVNMPSNPFTLPKQSGKTKARKIGEGVAATGRNFGTSAITFNASKLVEYYQFPEELTEDSAVDFMAVGRRECVMAQTRAAEAFMINGDADGTHIDSDTQAGDADLAEKVADGLRKKALVAGSTQSFGNAAITHANLKLLRAKMGKFGLNPNWLALIAGSAAYLQMVGLDEVTTVEKFGPMATILKGALAAWSGIPIYTAEEMREDLNASGVYDGMTVDRAGILIVNLSRFYLGQRRPIKLKVAPSTVDQDLWEMASYRRVDFQGHAQSASERSVVYGINIAK